VAPAHTTHEADCSSPARCYSNALLLFAIASLLVACSGTTREPGPGGGAVTCTTGPAPAVLSWDAVTDPDLAGYRIYYRTGPGAYQPYQQDFGQGVNVGNVTTYSVLGLSSGTTYYFAVTAYGSSINEGDFSKEVCKTIS